MGFFGLFKRAKREAREIVFVEEQDRKIVEVTKSKIQGSVSYSPKDKYHNSFGEDMRKLTPDGELPWGWSYENREFTEPLREKKINLDSSLYNSKKNGVLERRKVLYDFISFLKQTKDTCDSKGECFTFWYNEIFSYVGEIEELIEELKKIEDNLDEMISNEKMIEKLKADLLEIIKSEPGVIQSSLYKRFDESLKYHISNELYQMETHEIIIREKSGRSYKLFIKNGG